MENINDSQTKETLSEKVEAIISQGELSATDQAQVNRLALALDSLSSEDHKAMDTLAQKIKDGEIRVV